MKYENLLMVVNRIIRINVLAKYQVVWGLNSKGRVYIKI